MKQFNLEEWRHNAPICTRDGREVRILCVDYKNSERENNIVYIIRTEFEDGSYEECLTVSDEHGKHYKNMPIAADLCMRYYDAPYELEKQKRYHIIYTKRPSKILCFLFKCEQKRLIDNYCFKSFEEAKHQAEKLKKDMKECGIEISYEIREVK